MLHLLRPPTLIGNSIFQASRSTESAIRRKWHSSAEVIQQGDCALLQVRDEDLAITKPLSPTGTATTRVGDISHASLIGKRNRDVVKTKKGHNCRVYLPTLEQYVNRIPRLVTPIYPADANLMVSLLDLHVDLLASQNGAQPPAEILEAGTGHAGLTLHLARAIHAANVGSTIDKPHSSWISRALAFWNRSNPAIKSGSRRAIIHTVEKLPQVSAHARNVLTGFRQGLYSKNVDFHIDDVSNWIDRQFAVRGLLDSNSEDRTFLSHAILDLPKSYQHLRKIASALNTGGTLLVFNPSITQINSCVTTIRKERLLLVLDKVLELGPSLTGGRLWDVRAVKPRALLNAARSKAVLPESHRSVSKGDGTEDASKGSPPITASTPAQVIPFQDPENDDAGWELVCRPKVGDRVVGGGFLGVWKKM